VKTCESVLGRRSAGRVSQRGILVVVAAKVPLRLALASGNVGGHS
jgi:hypothetical protein